MRKLIDHNLEFTTSSIFVPQFEMMSSQQFKSMQELVEELSHYFAEVEEGNGDLDRLQEMADNARELYERLVVMRHKAFEETADEEVVKEIVSEPSPAPVVETESGGTFQEAIPFSIESHEIAETGKKEVEETDEDRVEPEPETTAVPENQTSLIDAIEEINEESVAEKYELENESESLVEKLEKAPIEDLVSVITLNQKFQFIKELFGGDNERYIAEIESFDSMDSWASAKNVLASLKKELKWEEGETEDEFMELIQRRHSSQT